jgi:hypothetical protein
MKRSFMDGGMSASEPASVSLFYSPTAAVLKRAFIKD